MNCNIDITGVVLKTERLILREWRLSDLEDFYEYCSVDGVGQMAGWLPHEDIEESQTVLGFFIRDKKTFAIVLKEGGTAYVRNPNLGKVCIIN